MTGERGHETKPILRPMGPLFRGSSAGEHSGSWTRPDTGRHREPSDFWLPADLADDRPGFVERCRDRWAAANPVWRWSVFAGLVLVLAAVIVLAASFAGAEAADRYGPLVPPSPTPYPDGWTYAGAVLLLGPAARRRVAALLAVLVLATAGDCGGGGEPGEPVCVDEQGDQTACPTEWTMPRG